MDVPQALCAELRNTNFTLLNTMSNLGGNWPAIVALWLVSLLTIKERIGDQGELLGLQLLEKYILVHAYYFPFCYEPKYNDANVLNFFFYILKIFRVV